VSDCTLCPLHESAITVCVPGRGEGEIMLVGQNPGAAEDLAGRAFIGRSGELLNAMLHDAGIDSKKVRITNAVRCKTPGNRPPTPAESGACRVHLSAELLARKPAVVVALGDTALRSLTGKAGLTKLRGTSLPLAAQYNLPGVEVWPTYHPAYVLRTPAARDTVVSDLRRVAERGRVEPDVQWRRYNPLPDDLYQFLDSAVDIETDWDPKTKTGGDRITQIAVTTRQGVFVTDPNPSIQQAAYIAQLRRPVTHNGWTFDIPRLEALSGIEMELGRDTIVLAYLHDETQPLGLESLCVKYLGVKGWKEGLSAPLGSDEFALYNARDAAYTLRLSKVLLELLGDRIVIADEIIRPAFEALRECSQRGIYIDASAVQRAKEHFTAEADAAVEEIRALVGYEINPRSPKQVGAALYSLGYTLKAKLDGLGKTTYRTDNDALSKLPQDDVVQAFRTFRKRDKAVSDLKKWEKIANSADPYAHTEYLLWRTKTGRTNSRNPNVQNLSRDPLMRAFFSAPPGYELATFDYSAIEFRMAAFVAQEESIIARYRTDPTFDPHRWFASILYSVPEREVTKEQRQIAKSANFGLLFMATAETLADYARRTAGVVLSDAEARRIRKLWHATFPGFGHAYANVAGDLRRLGYVESFTGRRRHLGNPELLTGRHWGDALREAVNFKLGQSPAADVALLGLGACHTAGLPINGFFHDAVSFQFRAGETEQHVDLITKCLTVDPVVRLRDLFGVELTIPLAVDYKIVRP
jgi:uracil-DNA glycosylase family 4